MYLQRRGSEAYNRRRTGLGHLSGTDCYEVLKRAGFCCELYGVLTEERALEVDYILPRKHGDRDAADFRAVRAAMDAKADNCAFCVVASNPFALAFRCACLLTMPWRRLPYLGLSCGPQAGKVSGRRRR